MTSNSINVRQSFIRTVYQCFSLHAAKKTLQYNIISHAVFATCSLGEINVGKQPIFVSFLKAAMGLLKLRLSNNLPGLFILPLRLMKTFLPAFAIWSRLREALLAAKASVVIRVISDCGTIWPFAFAATWAYWAMQLMNLWYELPIFLLPVAVRPEAVEKYGYCLYLPFGRQVCQSIHGCACFVGKPFDFLESPDAQAHG